MDIRGYFLCLKCDPNTFCNINNVTDVYSGSMMKLEVFFSLHLAIKRISVVGDNFEERRRWSGPNLQPS